MRALIRVLCVTIAEELSDINVHKPYKPRRIKQDPAHRIARRLYKLKSRNPEFKRKQKLYRKQYLKKKGNKMKLEKRQDVVHDARKRRGLDD